MLKLIGKDQNKLKSEEGDRQTSVCLWEEEKKLLKPVNASDG